MTRKYNFPQPLIEIQQNSLIFKKIDLQDKPSLVYYMIRKELYIRSGELSQYNSIGSFFLRKICKYYTSYHATE